MLSKEDFNQKSIEEQIEYINSEITEGKSFTQVSKVIGFDESTLRRRFSKEGYIRDKESKLYINTDKVLKDNNSNDNISKEENIDKRLNRLEEKINIIDKSIDKLMSNKNIVVTKNNKEVQGQQVFEIRKFERGLKQKTERYYGEVSEKLKRLYNKYPHLNKYDILNSLLDEILDKYI